METRNVTLTLEKAKEFYNSDNAALKEIALQAYTEGELTTPKYTDITTFGDACLALEMDINKVKCDLNNLTCMEGSLGKHLKAIYKLDIIRKALNKGWEPKMVEGSIYYPWVKIYPIGKEAKRAADTNGWRLGPTFIADNKKYTLVGGNCYCCPHASIANFGCGYGDILSFLGLPGCKSEEIAKHMSRYFAKEIFEATYAQHVGAYEWIDEV